GPDLVVVQKNAANLAERLSVLRQNVLELDHDTIPGIYRSLETLGRALGAESKAAAATARIRAELERVRALTAALPRRRVMFVVGRNPGTLQNVIAVGSSSYLNEIIELAGGENVFRSSVGAYPKVSLEEILARNPEVIVDMGEMAQTVGVTEAQKQAVAALWHRYPVLAAARNGRVFAVASDIFVVPGPRVVEAAREFARMLHPEARL
ncbi:MAG: hypothetical protein FJW37_10720, partial [Acidobacteria bacterium]|nr:hypothetical protein [Acidobacteriota bacterium]